MRLMLRAALKEKWSAYTTFEWFKKTEIKRPCKLVHIKNVFVNCIRKFQPQGVPLATYGQTPQEEQIFTDRLSDLLHGRNSFSSVLMSICHECCSTECFLIWRSAFYLKFFFSRFIISNNAVVLCQMCVVIRVLKVIYPNWAD